VNPVFFEPVDTAAVAQVRRQHGSDRPLLLYVGRRDPNRNLVPLIRTVGLLRERGVQAVLLVAGRRDPRYPEPEQVVDELRLQQSVKFLGFVELPDLRILYRAASVLVFPSFYEGFGLPPLEAMASGTPVVCSARASIPEVVGDAAVFVEPDQPESIASGVQRVLGDSALRAELVRRGGERARLFSWEKSAELVSSVYRQLAAVRVRGQ
jgi:glycosyltransferase involved in cell wall biosynthesis